MATIHSLGRRKTSIARVYLAPGSGDITVNSRDFKEYFPTGPLQYILRQAQTVINVVETYDIKITVDGGGIKGQAEAARLGIARALVKVAEENKSPLRKEGLLTREI